MKRAIVVVVLGLSLSGCTAIVCGLWSLDGCPGTGGYNMCRDKSYRKAHPEYCATPRPTP